MISVQNLSLRAGSFTLAGLSFQVPAGGYTVLMGRTGSGKTTLLESICGLNRPIGGRIQLMDRDVNGLRPAERNLGYVPQDRALFTTMSVRDNLAFSLRVRKWSAADMNARIDELADLLGIGSLLARRPANLSGGEAQRIALGRAIAPRPSVLLLDEPLSALDDQSRAEMYTLLERMRQSSPITTLHVTHHLEDAARLADQILLLEGGSIRPVAIPAVAPVR